MVAAGGDEEEAFVKGPQSLLVWYLIVITYDLETVAVRCVSIGKIFRILTHSFNLSKIT